MKNVEKLLEILKRRRNDLGYSLRKVEDLLKLKGLTYTHTAIGKMENGRNENIDPIILKELSKIYNLNLEDMFRLAGYDDLIIEKRNEEVMHLPLYGFASAGKGYINFDEEVREIAMPKLNSEISKNSFCAIVSGESMQPFYSDKDIIVINPDFCTDIELLNKKECVVDYNGERFLKKLIFEKGNLILRSYNEAYVDIIVPNERLGEVKCCGVVIMVLDMRV